MAAIPASLQVMQRNQEASLTTRLKSLPQKAASEIQGVQTCSQRGDVRLFLRKYDLAVNDYQRMIELEPAMDASHWRLGIALFMAGNPEKAAAQFDRYHAFDNVDRENGIWRYLSHCKAYGKERAAGELLKYEKEDRPPFAEVYRLFDGTMTVEQVEAAVTDDLPEEQRLQRAFYTDLYVGLFHTINNDVTRAKASLQRATSNPWPQTAGFGPNYMWHVARVQYFDLAEKQAGPASDPTPTTR